jgi:hypothetical protein
MQWNRLLDSRALNVKRASDITSRPCTTWPSQIFDTARDELVPALSVLVRMALISGNSFPYFV